LYCACCVGICDVSQLPVEKGEMSTYFLYFLASRQQGVEMGIGIGTSS